MVGVKKNQSCGGWMSMPLETFSWFGLKSHIPDRKIKNTDELFEKPMKAWVEKDTKFMESVIRTKLIVRYFLISTVVLVNFRKYILLQ